MNIEMPYEVEQIINIFYKNGYEAYVVGGCVRDSLLNKEPNDWDICTDCLPESIIDIFNNLGFKTVPTGIKHGTITLVINNNNYEITTYRTEGLYEDNRRPSNVVFEKNVIDDLSRRDFTINSMAYNYNNGLIDPFNGKTDLKKRIIRAVGNPNVRFREDALRIIRGVRFASQLEFKIEEETITGIKENRQLLKNISKERIREEINKILLSSKPSIGFTLFKNMNLLDYIILELKACIDFNQHNPHHDKDVFEHTLKVIDNTNSELIVRLAALLHDIAKPSCFTIDEEGVGHFYNHHSESSNLAVKILKSLKYDNCTVKNVEILVKEHMTKYNNPSDKAVKRLINRVGVDNINRLFDLLKADIIASKPPHDLSQVNDLEKKCLEIINEEQPLTVKDLKINGYDLIALGINPGKSIGEILGYLLDIVLEKPEINEKKLLLSIVKEKYIL